ncbi:hypothetical protein CBM2587_B60377 [Cupriavidus taiwanensis]|uniref:Uncharacterized protein n=1 Tax=Cupriavidus taiwanensis TaxID=164546 RepID=A0A375C6A4_9BURK|nr:hypothetical protein CBM2587_B60377 [Cupriavidus taiwanensis]
MFSVALAWRMPWTALQTLGDDTRGRGAPGARGAQARAVSVVYAARTAKGSVAAGGGRATNRRTLQRTQRW